MFDFFRDLYLESRGIDSFAAEKLRKKKKEIKIEKRFIFTKKMKALIIFLGILYLFIAISSLFTLRDGDILFYIKYFIFFILDIIICISLILGTKKCEIIALVGIVIFIFGNYLYLFI